MRYIPVLFLTVLTGLAAGCTPADEAADAPPAQEMQGFDAPVPDAFPEAPDEQVRQAVRDAALEVEEGSATFYADTFEGRRTASGRAFRQSEMVAAHRAFPFNTRLRVTNERNGREVEVRVVDRGPHQVGEGLPPIIDLSRAAAEELDFIGTGRTEVTVEVLEWGP